MTPGEQSKFEQDSAAVSDWLPVFWKRLYDNMLKEGFNELQAMTILRAYITKREDH